jgi:hypothetical protein
MSIPIPLSLVPRKIAELSGGRAPTYPEIYRAVLNAKIPATQTRGRWHVESDDLPAAARACGIELEKA